MSDDLLFNRPKILKRTPEKNKLSIVIRKDRVKGNSLFAIKPIKKDDIIAYYKMKVVHGADPKHNFRDSMYLFNVTNSKGREYSYLYGDLYAGSLPNPIRHIPYWAYFSNEPNVNQESNSYIDYMYEDNFTKKKRTVLKVGDTIRYALKAARDIEKGEEIMWCYGEGYDRNYKTGCDKKRSSKRSIKRSVKKSLKRSVKRSLKCNSRTGAEPRKRSSKRSVKRSSRTGVEPRKRSVKK